MVTGQHMCTVCTLHMIPLLVLFSTAVCTLIYLFQPCRTTLIAHPRVTLWKVILYDSYN